MLAIGSALMLASGVAFYFSDDYFVLLGAAIFGIISPSGNETGPFSALEQAILSQLTEQEGRVSLLMWYAVIGYAGMGVGNLATSFVVSSFDRAGKSDLAAYRVIFLIYGAIAAFKVALSFALSAKCEVDAPTPPRSAPSSANEGERQPLLDNRTPSADATVQTTAPLAVGRLMTLCLIFSLDSFASSLGTGSFIAYFLRTTFAAPIALIAQVMSVTAITTCLSQLAAGSLAKRLGVIYTMVCTHVPAQIFTILFGLAPTLPLALTLLIARSCLTSMDSSVRVINVCKTLASTPGPTLSLALVSLGSSRIVFVLMGGIKILYNVILLVLFKTAPLQH
ncbi:hypothetical protein Rhopal_003247-T1 [Rhodotorula paludigena]|uniref:Uncharacterized protein n=1 Tax=Rhodotorula paludigena TaxID=86838 RepID=A0AAV5GNI0_9BASI|nr:hypothetical protein Rhopal_003247-T1 [Rhodotorula paludigena]